MISNILKHLNRILKHKFWVFYYCCKLGIPQQGITHDLSKFSWIEFSESIKYFKDGISPIKVSREVNGYSLAWQHHKGRNPHHYEYWTDNYDSGTTCIEMPFKYVLELVADYLAAGKTYHGNGFTIKQELEWWNNCKDNLKMHDNTKKLVTRLFEHINDYGFKNIK